MSDDSKEADVRVLITGGTGFIGRPLSKRALQKGWQVTLMVRNTDTASARELTGEGATLVRGDVTDRNSLKAAFEAASPELYFHVAGWYELGVPRSDRRHMWAVNVDGLDNGLALAAEYGVQKTVYTSSTTALGDTGGEVVDETFVRRTPPITYYEYTKHEAHKLAKQHQSLGTPIVLACPAQAIGPGDHSPFGHFARLFVRGLLPPLIWAPDGAFTYGYVDDVANALVLAAEHGQVGETYFIAGKVLTNRAMMRVWGEVTGRRPPFIWLPRPVALAQSMLVAPLLRLMGQSAFISPDTVRSSYASFRYRSDKAEHQLGASFRSAEQAWAETLQAEAIKADVRIG
jgi:dihydroflavonol-4-reductase